MRRVDERVPFVDLVALHQELEPSLSQLVASVISAGRFVGGDPVEHFEHSWASYCGRSEAIGVANGTDALTLAIRALGIGTGDEVLVPANTFIATAEAVVGAGATPVFVDVDDDSLLIDLDDAATAVTGRTVAIIAVHLFGQPVDAEALERFVVRHGLALIEDAAQAHGGRFADGRKVGSIGDVACFSFYPGKNLGAFGDGGAVVTDDPEVADTIRSTADHGRSAGSKQIHDLIGVNSRLDTLQAAVLSLKLEHLEDWNARRRRVAAVYDAEFAGTQAHGVQTSTDVLTAQHLYVIRTPDRDELMSELDRRGIDTGIHYAVPCHQQPAFRRFADRPLRVAERAAVEIVSLPMSPTLTDDQVGRVTAAVTEFASTPMAMAGR